MLEVLQSIVQAAARLDSLEEMLELIVHRVKTAMHVQVCSVYLREADGALSLRATQGLAAESVGRVRLGAGEGLVGLVAERQEPVNLDDAAAHPSFHFVPETAEGAFHAFLGVPIIQFRQALGVLVVQHYQRRHFDQDEVAFLMTVAAQLAGAIYHAAATSLARNTSPARVREGLFASGVSGAPGVAIGTIALMNPLARLAEVPDRAAEDPEAEEQAFRVAVIQLQEELESGRNGLHEALPQDARALFEVYRMVLDGDTLVTDTIRRIREGSWAPAALRDTITEHARVFDDMEDPYLRARAEDVRDIGRRILAYLQRGTREERVYPERCVLVGDLVSIADLARVPIERLAGIVCTRGSIASHIAVLANALGVPAVMSLGELAIGQLDGSEIVVDGYRGRVCVDPPPAVRDEFLRLAAQDQALSDELRSLRDQPAETSDRARVALYANLGLLSDLEPGLASGAEGVGLYRTEFPFMVRQSFPGEDEQYRVYREVLEAFAPRPVTMRTLDIGGDKPLPYFHVEEENPFLGWRGIRFTLDHPEIFLVQLKALLRANAGLGNLRLLLPMVSRLDEIDAARARLLRACHELEEDGVAVGLPLVGSMIEVPALLFQAEALVRRVDFVSIGSNDLAQYLLAVDRNNERVAALYDPLHPAVLAAIAHIVRVAHAAGKTAGLCGEMAGDPGAALLLLGTRIDSLSMSASRLPRVKWALRTFSRARASELLERAVAMDDGRAVREMLNRELAGAGLGALVGPGGSVELAAAST